MPNKRETFPHERLSSASSQRNITIWPFVKPPSEHNTRYRKPAAEGREAWGPYAGSKSWLKKAHHPVLGLHFLALVSVPLSFNTSFNF